MKESVEAIDPPFAKRLDEGRRTSGIQGSATQHLALSIRCSTGATMLRRLIQLMVDMNEVLATGIYSMRRHYPENVGEAARRHSTNDPGKIRLNVNAWENAADALNAFFQQGPLALMGMCSFFAFPVRYRTTAKCGKCRQDFDPLSVCVHKRLSSCLGCGCFFCNSCCLKSVHDLHESKRATASEGSISYCATCVPT